MTKNHVFNNVALEMSAEQENYVPHWIVRFSDEIVSDYCLKNNLKSMTRPAFLEILKQKLDLTTKAYDFSGLKRLKAPIVAKPDVTTDRFQQIENSIRVYQQEQMLTDKQIIQKMKDAKLSDDEIAQHFKKDVKTSELLF